MKRKHGLCRATLNSLKERSRRKFSESEYRFRWNVEVYKLFGDMNMLRRRKIQWLRKLAHNARI